MGLRVDHDGGWGGALGGWQARARVEELLGSLKCWGKEKSSWKPWRGLTGWFDQAIGRCERGLERIDRPLVVATFGGTGSGKSTLINALVGSEVSVTGRERPTTTCPVVIVHAETNLEGMGLPLDEVEVVRSGSEVLRRVVLIDCPDPDTSESAQGGTNTARLRGILPHVDVLLYVTTQQKYRSARVVEELLSVAPGCRFLFVQSHADVDMDIREDWGKQLRGHFEVPEMFLIDSLSALTAQRGGTVLPEEFARLVGTLVGPAGEAQRDALRLANVCQLMLEMIGVVEKDAARLWPRLEELRAQMDVQQQRLVDQMSSNLSRELTLSKGLWEQRLLGEVLTIWEMTPFSAMLRVYNSLGSLAASVGLMRARTTAHLAIIGAIQGARWLSSQQENQAAQDRFKQMQTLCLDESLVQEVEMIIAGYEQSAGFEVKSSARASKSIVAPTERGVEEGVRLEQSFLERASKLIDQLLQSVAIEQTRWGKRAVYETLFGLYVAFVVVRIGYNFFVESLWEHERIMKLDFYLPAGIFFVLWTGGLIMFYLRGLQRSLAIQLADASRNLAQLQVPRTLFGRTRRLVEQTQVHQADLLALKREIEAIYGELAPSTPGLGQFVG